jgi:hypothetical protein
MTRRVMLLCDDAGVLLRHLVWWFASDVRTRALKHLKV